MDNQLIVIGIAAVVVIAATFVLRNIAGLALRLAGLGTVAFLGHRQALGAAGFGWIEGQDATVIGASALFGLVVAMVLNAFVFREDGFARHFFVPLIAVGLTYAAAFLTKL